jgi:RNA polymerase sigma factor (sigma-70 family)
MTALPFDLSEFASAADDSSDSTLPGHPLRGAGSRASYAIVIPATTIERVQARDVEAFRELVRATYAPLVRFGRSILQSRDDAEDIVQDVFTVIWDLGARWNPAHDPVAYLFASVRNRALKELRRRSRATMRAQRSLESVSVEAGTLTTDELGGALAHVVDSEVHDIRVRQVSAVLATLSERYRTVYDLRYRRGLTVAAIAEVLGTTHKSAEHLTGRVTRLVLERLREIVRKPG